MKRKTIAERILAIASRRRFNSTVARENFKGFSKNRIQNSVMRTARSLAEAGELVRVSRGTYRAG